MAKLFFRHAEQSAGKTTAILCSATSLEEQGTQVKIFIPQIILNNDLEVIHPPHKSMRDAKVFNRTTTFNYRILDSSTSCIFIDDAHRLTRAQVKQLHDLAHTSFVPIFCYGLSPVVTGASVEGVDALLEIADSIDELRLGEKIVNLHLLNESFEAT